MKVKDKNEIFDEKWKFWSLHLAAMELLELDGLLDSKKLFKRAKELYNFGYEYKIDKWRSFWKIVEEEKKEARKKKQEIKENVEIVENKEVVPIEIKETKQCPKCLEMIPEQWQVHSYSKDGKPCGQKF